jgi:hypothetical protein
MANAAVRFDASADKYSRLAAGLGSSDFTICCWVKIQVDRNAFGGIVACDNAGSGYQSFGVNSTGTALGCFSAATDTFQTAGTFDLTVGTWTFVARTFTTTATGHIYKALSGAGSLTEAANAPGFGTPMNDSWTLCIGNDGYGDWMNASIAAVKIWSASLTSTELLAEMATYQPVRTSNLWANYTFYNGPQTNDESGNSRTLTAGGTLTTDSSGPPITLGGSGPTYSETGLSVAIASTVALTDTYTTHHFVDTGLSLPIISTVSSIDSYTHTSGGGSVSAVRFDASADKYTRSASGLNTSTSITWCCWVKFASDRNAYTMVLSSNDNVGTLYVELGAGGDGTSYALLSTSGGASSSFQFTPGTWTFIAATMDIVGANDYLYHAESPATTLTGDFIFTLPTGWADTNTLYIGSSFFGDWLDGSVAQVKIWTRALTQAQLEAEMYADSVVGGANLWAYYSFRAGPQTNDESGNGRTLTVGGTLATDTSGPFGSSSTHYDETLCPVVMAVTTASTAAVHCLDTGRSLTVVSTVGCTDTYHPATPSDWQAAVDSGSLATMQAWYAANCGYLAEGFLESSMWGNIATDVSVTSSWLTTNAAAGRVVNDGGGHWTVTGLRCHTLEIRVSNITFRHMHLDQAGDLDPSFAPGVITFDPSIGSPDAVTLTNIRFEYCTVESGGVYWVTQKQRTSNVCTLTYTKGSSQTPLLTVGQTLEIRIGDSTFDYNVEATQNPARATITAVTPTTFSYTKAGANVSPTATPAGSFATTFSEGDSGDVVYYDPSDATAVWNGMFWDHCIGKDYVAAFKLNRGTTVQYCWVPSLTFYGLDPHNTSSSIRGKYCRLFRNLFETGTSSAVSLYADNYPFTEFELHENILHAPTDYTVNFPLRNPWPPAVVSWSPLENGFRRELVGNYLMRGSAGYVDDTAYFSKTFDNKLFDGTPVPDLMDEGAPSVSTEPHLIKTCWNNFGGGAMEYLNTWEFTPSPNSTLFVFAGIVQGGHSTTQAPTVTVTGQYPQTFSAVTNTALQNAPGADAAHGMRLWLYKAETGSTTSFEHIRFDPYAGTQIAYICFWVYEVTGVTGMNLVHSSGKMATSVDTITSNALSGSAANGNLSMAFAAATVLDTGAMSLQSGWQRIGVQDIAYSSGNYAVTGAAYWRKDFTGTTFTISDLGNSVQNAGVLLTEYTVPGGTTYIETNRPVTVVSAVASSDQADFEDHPVAVVVVATTTLPTENFSHVSHFVETGLPVVVIATTTLPTENFTHIGYFDEQQRSVVISSDVNTVISKQARFDLNLGTVVVSNFTQPVDQVDFEDHPVGVAVATTIGTVIEKVRTRDLGLALSIVSTATNWANRADYNEPNRPLVIVAGVSCTDLHQAPGHFDETGNLIQVVSTITASSQADFEDHPVGLVIAATVVSTDSRRCIETGRSVTAVSAVALVGEQIARRDLDLSIAISSTVTNLNRASFYESLVLPSEVLAYCLDGKGVTERLTVVAPLVVGVEDRASYHQNNRPLALASTVTNASGLHVILAIALVSIVSEITSADSTSRVGVIKLNDADLILLGTEPVSKVYLGATQVWP